jgi:hypothetical protein
MIHFYSNYCHRKVWICISIGTIFIACCTLIVLFIYHYQKCYRRNLISYEIKNSAQNFNENMVKISNQYRIKRKVDRQIEELIRLTPIIPFEQIKFNEFNQILIKN